MPDDRGIKIAALHSPLPLRGLDRESMLPSRCAVAVVDHLAFDYFNVARTVRSYASQFAARADGSMSTTAWVLRVDFLHRLRV